MQKLYYACMTVNITVRHVALKVRNELASRAALEGQSLQGYLRSQLEALAQRPTTKQWIEQVRKRKQRSAIEVSTQEVLRQLAEDRR